MYSTYTAWVNMFAHWPAPPAYAVREHLTIRIYHDLNLHPILPLSIPTSLTHFKNLSTATPHLLNPTKTYHAQTNSYPPPTPHASLSYSPASSVFLQFPAAAMLGTIYRLLGYKMGGTPLAKRLKKAAILSRA